MQINISGYEGFGDPDQPIEHTPDVDRRQQQCMRMWARAEEESRKRPPRPLPDKTVELIRSILANPTPDHELMRWRLRLYCGHVIESTANVDNKTYGKPGIGGRHCTECGSDHQTVVASKPLGTVAQREKRSATSKPRTPSSNRQRISDLEAEVESLRRQLEKRDT